MTCTCHTAVVLAAVLLAACSADETSQSHAATAIVDEAFVTRIERGSNLDSPALWRSSSGATWLVTTAKSSHRLHIHDAASGAFIRTVGQHGSGPVEFRRPNGLAVVGDLLFVVERDNARVQVLRLPRFEFVASFGQTTLHRPYGIAILQRDAAEMDVFITDVLTEPVKRYRLATSDAKLGVTYLGAFGDTTGAGRLQKVESMAVDPDARVLLVADEMARDVKVYGVNGSFSGRVLWGDVLHHEPEGIVLYACGADDGYWIVADQHIRQNRLLVFHRRTYNLVGAFTGRIVRNTDGLALMQDAVGSMAAGALYAVHADRAVGAFSWSKVAAALELRDDCATSEGNAALHVEPLLLAPRISETERLTERGQPETAAEGGVPPAIAFTVEPDAPGVG
ncbi:MAG: hypothetical protein ACT4O1_11645, partial [Gemmatimonadota bacterium]